MSRKKNSFVVSSPGLIPYSPHKNIAYADITIRPQTYYIVASDVQIVCFDLASNLRSLKLLHKYHVTKFFLNLDRDCRTLNSNSNISVI